MLDIQKMRTWIMLYLISFVALLWAVFLVAHGTTLMFWMSVFLIVLVIGINFILILNELRMKKMAEDRMKSLSNKG